MQHTIYYIQHTNLQAGFIRFTKKSLIMMLAVVVVTTSSGLIYMFLGPKKASAAWFDDNWAYRTSYSINNTGSAVSYQKVKIDIDTATLITNGKIQSDCGDSRFTNEAGELLRYFLDSAGGACNTISTDYYVLLPNIPAGRSLIYHYYGNPAAQDGTEAAQFSEATFTPAAGPTAATEEKGTGPVGYWKFDEGYGTTASDAATQNNDGSISGASWLTEDMCLSGKCLRYDGTDDVTTVTNASGIDLDAQLAAAFTISAWVRADGAGEGTGGQVFFKGTNTWLRVDTLSGTNLDVEASLDLATTDATVNISAPITTNAWYHIVMVYTDDADDEIDIYIDGKLRGSSTNGSGAPAADTNNLLIGGTTTNNFDGQIDEFKIYNYARTTAQIQADFIARGASKGQGTVFGAQTQNLKGALSDGLVGYWKMNETSANTCSGGVNDSCDSSGNARDGAWNGNATTTGTAKFGNATTYDGSADYISGTLSPNIANSSFTIAGWVNETNLSVDRTWFSVGSVAGTNTALHLRIISTGALRFGFYANDLDTPASTFTAGTWHHVVYTYDNTTGTRRIFLNGEQKATDTSTAAFSGNANFSIGAWVMSGGESWLGQIDEARIYNRALTPNEVEQLYNFAPGPVGYWNMDEKSGTTAFDQSTNANNGTLTGGPTWTQGRFGAGINFDGTDDTIGISPAPMNPTPTSSFTIQGWVNFYSFTAGEKYTFGLNDYPAGNNQFVLRIEWDNVNITFNACKQTVACQGVSTAVSGYSTGRWYHLAGVYDNTAMRFYIDGILVGTNTFTETTAVQYTGAFNMASRNGCCYGNIKLDDVKVYNYARTAKQILEDMLGSPKLVSSGGGNAGSGPVAHWNLDQGFGTTAQDTSSNDNDLTLSAASWTNSGKFGKAWDGTGARWLSRADDADFDFAAAEDLTVSLWLKSDSATNPSATEYLFNKASATVAGYAVYATTTGTICFGIDDDTVWTPDDTACSTTDYYDAAWHHIVATKTGTSRIDIYVDGYSIASDTSIAATGTLANALTMYAGDRDGVDNGDEFNGDIDEIKVYRGALTASEVRVEYNRGAGIALGALGDSSTYQPQAANQEYCVPGDTTSCAAPVGEWKMDEKSGTSANDTSGNGFTGTLTGGPTWIQGRFGAGINFDGSNDCVSVANAGSLNITGTITLEAWVYPTSLTGAPTIIQKQDGASGQYFLRFNSGLNGAVWTGGAWQQITSASSGTANQWQHVAFTYDGSNMRLFYNGSNVATSTQTGAINTTTGTFGIGAWTSCSGNAYTGKIDDARIYNYARTAAQIVYDYNRGAPVGWWKFDEGQTATANDSAVNANNTAVGNNGSISAGSLGITTVGDINTASTMWDNGQTGKYNYSLDYDGSDDVTTVTNATAIDLNTNSSYTFSAWINADGAGESSVGQVFQKGATTYLRVDTPSGSNLDVEASLDLATTDATLNISAPITTTTWNHVVVTYTDDADDEITIYINGLSRGSSTDGSGAPAADTNNLLIGGTTTANFDGRIDDFRMYNYEMTATQVRDLYNHGAVRFGPLTGSP